MKPKKTILIIEDEKVLRDALVAMLSGTYQTLEAGNGREGVDSALSKHPDLILLDLIMPEMDGMTAFKLIREDSWGAHVPVIILTNLSATDEQLVEEVVIRKPMHYLIKSDWKLSDVIQKIEDVLTTDVVQ